MATKTPRLYLEHIQEAIAEIDQFATGKTFEDLAADNLLRRAIERSIEIISEASRRLPADMKARYPDIPGPRSPRSATCFATNTTQSSWT